MISSKGDSDLDVCFILGIQPRSGTNYLYSLIGEHPDCATPGPIWEDFFLEHSNMLRNYVDALFLTWNPKWEIDKKVGPKEKLLRLLGDAIIQFLKLQLEGERSPANDSQKQVLLTKTPSVIGLNNFFDIFSDSYLIIIVRDGRAVVESGVRTFGWDYEIAMQKWRDSARKVIDFVEQRKDEDKFIMVKYEDVFANEKSSLLRLFDYMNLDASRYDFESAASLGVLGSSKIREHQDSMHWKAVEKPENFNPLDRFSNWSKERHERFNWIAGTEMSELGYQLNRNGKIKKITEIKNRFLDGMWIMKKIGWRVERELARVKNEIYA